MAINQSITIRARPDEVFVALASAEVFGKVTGAPADLEEQEGGAFSLFGGQITGRTVEIIPNKRIVQAWRAEPWPEGAYSIVKFEIKKTGTTTTVNLEHAGFPDNAGEHLEGGWHKMYWEPLKAYFE